MGKKCRACGAELTADMKYCTRCGMNTAEVRTVDTAALRRRIVAMRESATIETAEEKATKVVQCDATEPTIVEADNTEVTAMQEETTEIVQTETQDVVETEEETEVVGKEQVEVDESEDVQIEKTADEAEITEEASESVQGESDVVVAIEETSTADDEEAVETAETESINDMQEELPELNEVVQTEAEIVEEDAIEAIDTEANTETKNIVVEEEKAEMDVVEEFAMGDNNEEPQVTETGIDDTAATVTVISEPEEAGEARAYSSVTVAEEKAAVEEEKPVETPSTEVLKKKWIKLVGIVGAVLLALAFLWHVMEGAREAREHQNYQDGIQGICSDIMDTNHTIDQFLQGYCNPELRDSSLEQIENANNVFVSMQNKYDSLRPPKDMETVHKNVGEILGKEAELRQLIVTICRDPISNDTEKNLAKVTECIRAIKAKEKEVSMFDRSDNLDDVNTALRNALRSDVAQTKEALSQIEGFGDKCEEAVRKIDFDNPDSIEKGRMAFELQLTKLKQLKKPSGTDYVSDCLESVLDNRIKLCDKLLQIHRGVRNGSSRADLEKWVEEAKELLRKCDDEFERYQTHYVRYDGMVEEVKSVL